MKSVVLMLSLFLSITIASAQDFIVKACFNGSSTQVSIREKNYDLIYEGVDETGKIVTTGFSGKLLRIFESDTETVKAIQGTLRNAGVIDTDFVSGKLYSLGDDTTWNDAAFAGLFILKDANSNSYLYYKGFKEPGVMYFGSDADCSK